MPCDDDALKVAAAAAAPASAPAGGERGPAALTSAAAGMEGCVKEAALEARAAMGTSMMAAAFAVAPSRYSCCVLVEKGSGSRSAFRGSTSGSR